MSDPGPVSLEPSDQRESKSAWALRNRFGLLVMLTGNLLVIVAFFSPWFDVFKLNDPSFPFPKRGYSPWMVLVGGGLGTLSVVVGLFFLLSLGMALGSLTLVLTPTERRRSQATSIVRALVVVSLVVMVVGVPFIPVDLSFFWPYLSSTPAYGLFLALAGFLSVLISLAMLSAAGTRRQ